MPAVADFSIDHQVLIAARGLDFDINDHRTTGISPSSTRVRVLRIAAGGSCANSLYDDGVALSQAPQLGDVTEVRTADLPLLEHAPIKFEETLRIATGLTLNKNLSVKGSTGVGTTGASGTVDRLLQEIVLSLEERPTLVVWLFDQSASLIRQRQEIHDRFSHIYDELRFVEVRHRQAGIEQPLLTSIVGFGSQINLLTRQPTADVELLKQTLSEIERDDSGIENVFQAILSSAHQFARLRKSGQRNVMMIVITDEAGDDQQLLDPCVAACRKYEMPVFVVGVPAPFGRRQAAVKWVDPDPNYDQTPQTGWVDQGPETLLSERIKLRAPGDVSGDEMIDSGFGPFALTRLCYESGGIYFAVHPNREIGKDLQGWQTAAFSSYLQRFFDPDVMRRYRPEYVSSAEYLRQVQQLKCRAALVQAAKN